MNKRCRVLALSIAVTIAGIASFGLSTKHAEAAGPACNFLLPITGGYKVGIDTVNRPGGIGVCVTNGMGVDQEFWVASTTTPGPVVVIGQAAGVDGVPVQVAAGYNLSNATGRWVLTVCVGGNPPAWTCVPIITI